MNFDEKTALAEDVTRLVLAELPPPVRRAVAEVPIFMEDYPGEDDVGSGLDPDNLGLFDPGSEVDTPRIRLWLENIWEESAGDIAVFREEVRITLLHEIGHLLGWNEDEVGERGLE